MTQGARDNGHIAMGFGGAAFFLAETGLIEALGWTFGIFIIFQLLDAVWEFGRLVWRDFMIEFRRIRRERRQRERGE